MAANIAVDSTISRHARATGVRLLPNEGAARIIAIRVRMRLSPYAFRSWAASAARDGCSSARFPRPIYQPAHQRPGSTKTLGSLGNVGCETTMVGSVAVSVGKSLRMISRKRFSV